MSDEYKLSFVNSSVANHTEEIIKTILAMFTSYTPSIDRLFAHQLTNLSQEWEHTGTDSSFRVPLSKLASEQGYRTLCWYTGVTGTQNGTEVYKSVFAFRICAATIRQKNKASKSKTAILTCLRTDPPKSYDNASGNVKYLLAPTNLGYQGPYSSTYLAKVAHATEFLSVKKFLNFFLDQNEELRTVKDMSHLSRQSTLHISRNMTAIASLQYSAKYRLGKEDFCFLATPLGWKNFVGVGMEAILNAVDIGDLRQLYQYAGVNLHGIRLSQKQKKDWFEGGTMPDSVTASLVASTLLDIAR